MDEKKSKFVEGKTPISQLQERLIRNGIKPKYELVYDSTTRPCGVTKFTWQVSIEDIVVYGTANTKKSAKQEAAKNMLIQISRDEEIGLLQRLSTPTTDNFVNRIGNLSMFCSRNSLPVPTYKEYESDGPPHIRQFFCDCFVGRNMETGIAKSKKEAKQRAAQQMYEKLFSSITNPNDATAVDRRPELACKIEKTDPWLKSEKIKSGGIEPLETSDGEEDQRMSPEPNYEGTSANVDPTHAVDYRPGCRAPEEVSQEIPGHSTSQEAIPENGANEEILEKKFKINLSLFARSNVYKEVQSARNIDAGFNGSEGVEEGRSEVEENGTEASADSLVGIGKMENSRHREEANDRQTVEADDFHQEVKVKAEALEIPNSGAIDSRIPEEVPPLEVLDPIPDSEATEVKSERLEKSVRIEDLLDIPDSDTTESNILEEATVPEVLDQIPDSEAPKVKSERVENSDQNEERPPDLEEGIDVLDHEITPKVEVEKMQEETPSPNQTDLSEQEETSAPEETAGRVELDTKSNIENLLNTIKLKYPELLKKPEDPVSSEPEEKSSSIENSLQLPAATMSAKVPEESCKTEMMDIEESISIQEEFTSEERAEQMHNPEENVVIEMNNNDYSTETKPDASDVKQNPSLMPVITMQREIEENPSSELQNCLQHVKRENEMNSVPIKPEINIKYNSIDHMNEENQENSGDFDTQNGEDIEGQNGGDIKGENGGDIEGENERNFETQNGGDFDAQNGRDIKGENERNFETQNGRDFDAQNKRDIDVHNVKDFDAQNGGDIKGENGGNIDTQNGGDIKGQNVEDFDARNGGDIKGENGGDIDAQNGGDIKGQNVEDFDTQNGGDINSPTIISNDSESVILIKESDRKKVSEYHYMMMNEYGIDLRTKVLGKIGDLIEAMMKCESKKNLEIVDDGIAILHDILLLIDLFLCKVTFRAHDLHYIVVIHVNSIPEIVEVTKGGNLNEITRIAFFRVIERLKKILQ